MIVKFSGPSTVTKHFYYNWGGCYKEAYSVYLTNICKTNEQIVNTEIKMHPNPGSDRITISSNSLISSIEISSLLNPVLKRIKVGNMKTLTVSVLDLKPGIYNCKITTDKGIENKKLIIQR